jgi:hypothetical protein
MIWLGCAVAIALVAVLSQLPAAACCANPKGHVVEPHHGYLVVFVGVPWLPVQVLALACGIEDLVQHLIQLYGPDKYWKGPIHRVADWVGVI